MAEPIERRFLQELPRYYDLYVPDGMGPFPLLLAMHGYGGDKASMMRLARRIADDRLAIASLQGPWAHIVAPEERSRPLKYGFGWLTNFKPEESITLHRDAVLAIPAELASDPRIDTSRVFLLGFSQAVALNFRVAFAGPTRVRGIVGICGGIPGDWDEGQYRDAEIDVLLVAGQRDEFYPPDRVEQNAEKLRRRARSVEVHTFDAGHEVPPDSLQVIAGWLAARSAGLVS